ncbi:MAG: 3'-5' exoribonuclease YhaM family protein [Nanobdellota archaeon]
MIRKKQFIKDLNKDDIVNDVFVIKFKKPVETYKNGFRFELRVGDSTKEIMLKYWGSDDENYVRKLYDSLEKGDVILVQGRINEWRDKLEISANERCEIRKLEEGEYDPKDFIKQSSEDKEKMWNDFSEMIKDIENEDIRKVLEEFFHNQDFAEKFKESPAAMYIHHGWVSGLLEHSLSVTKIARDFCRTHNMDKDLVTAGAMLHDIGKVKEFNMTTSINVTTEGMLIGHVTIGTKMLNDVMDKLQTPRNIRLKLLHTVLTHMGEYGSSKLPAFPEAYAVFYADRVDTDLTHMITIKNEAQTEDDYMYDRHMGNIYLK